MTDKKAKGFAVKEKPVTLESIQAKPVRLCCYVTPTLRNELKSISGASGIQLQKLVERLLVDALEDLKQSPRPAKISKMIEELQIEEYRSKNQ